LDAPTLAPSWCAKRPADSRLGSTPRTTLGTTTLVTSRPHDRREGVSPIATHASEGPCGYRRGRAGRSSCRADADHSGTSQPMRRCGGRRGSGFLTAAPCICCTDRTIRPLTVKARSTAARHGRSCSEAGADRGEYIDGRASASSAEPIRVVRRAKRPPPRTPRPPQARLRSRCRRRPAGERPLEGHPGRMQQGATARAAALVSTVVEPVMSLRSVSPEPASVRTGTAWPRRRPR
jgi:hypothetical protein